MWVILVRTPVMIRTPGIEKRSTGENGGPEKKTQFVFFVPSVDFVAPF
jgi:hypothetical protein